MDVIDKIDLLMKQKGVSAYRAAKDIGFSNGLFTQWRKHLQTPSADKLSKIANYFGVTVDYLMGNEHSRPEFEVETFDDFSYAMHNESGNLSDSDKEILLNLAKDMAKHRKEKDNNSRK